MTRAHETAEAGTDNGPPCVRCAGTIWFYMIGAFALRAKCMSCLLVEEYDAPDYPLPTGVAAREYHEQCHWKAACRRGGPDAPR